MTVAGSDPVSFEELQLAARNHGLPLEALRWPLTPVGLHYLLIHYDIPMVDAAGWRLEVGGRVAAPLSLSLDELRRRPVVSLPVTFECAGNGRALLSPRPRSQPWLVEAVGTAEWTGTPLRSLLAEAGVNADGVVEVLFTGSDRGVEGGVQQRYERSLPLAEALAEDVLLAWAVNGQPLPPQHGAPLRLVVPGWYGMTNVKWLERITVLDEPFAGYQQAEAYRLLDGQGPDGPVTRMRPRALLVPPGIPDFYTRRRLLGPGPCRLEGRAWSGSGQVTAVEVSDDDGRSWAGASLGEPVGRWAWRPWALDWSPPGPGEYVLCCRATDATGERQPSGPVWNRKGYANNAVHRVPVTVTAS